MPKFLFELGQKVVIAASGESGEVIGRAEYLHVENNYFVHYKDGTGRAVERWWGESSLVDPTAA